MNSPASTQEGERSTAIIYTHSLLAGSMTFIRSHAEALKGYKPVYAGAHRVQGLELPAGRVHVVNAGSPVGMMKEFAFREWSWAPGLMRKLRQHDPAIVHTHFGTAAPAGMTISRSLGVPHIVTFHGKDATMPVEEARRSRRGRDLLRNKHQLIDHTGVFIAVSDYLRRSLLAQGYPDEKIVVHRNGIDLSFFGLPPRQPREATVLFVGRFVEKKGVRYLIEAVARMQAKGVNVELVLIGDGPLQPELESLARSADVKCRFEGFLPIEEVRKWLGRVAVVAVPSVVAANGDTEGLPTILLEAQAMQTPLVATRHSGIPEGVKEGVTAELVDEKDVEGLANSLASFVESPSKVERFGASGRQFVADCFDIRNQVKGLEEIYSRLCAERISNSRARV